jgi:hypothetical protein
MAGRILEASEGSVEAEIVLTLMAEKGGVR